MDRLKRRLRLIWLALTMPRIAGGAPEGDDPGDKPPATGGEPPDPPKEGDPPKADPPKEGDPPKAGDDDPDRVTSDDDWQTKSRKHERRAKREREAREEVERKLAEERRKNQTDAEKAIEDARAEGRKAAEDAATEERRRDRLEVAVVRAAAAGVEVKDGDDTKTLRFADPEDALVFIEREIREGMLDDDDIFDDKGKVKTDALKDALADLLKRKPRLAADFEDRSQHGSGDGGRGAGGSGGGYEEMTPADFDKRKREGAAK